MSLRIKVGLLLMIVFAVLLGIDMAAQRLVIMPSFVRLEKQEAIQDLQRCRQALDREIEHLELTCRDWGSWDDSYEFVVDLNESFIQSSLNIETFDAAGLDLVYFCDPEGRVVWGQLCDAADREPIEIASLPMDRLPPDHPILSPAGAEVSAHGLIQTEHGTLLLASVPILTSEGTGPPRGRLIMGRFLTEEGVEGIAEQTRVAFTVAPVSEAKLDQQGASILSAIRSDTTTHIADDEIKGHLALYGVIDDLWGAPGLLLRADVARSITGEGAASLRFATLSVIAAGLATLLTLMIGLQRIFIGPVTRLRQEASRIGEEDDLSTRLTTNRRDEIGHLIREFDSMVQRLAESRQELVETSRQVGMAEVAVGVLHNIGNVLNSVNVSAHVIGQRVRTGQAAKAGEAAKLLEENRENLSEFIAGDARGKMLPDYLTQLLRQIEADRSSTMSELESLGANIQHASEIIQAQQSYAMNIGLYERVAVGGLVDKALAIVDSSFDRHEIELVLDYDEGVSIISDKARILQVFVNLLKNAKEAIKDSTTENDRRITVRVRATPTGGAVIDITDTGIGIEKANTDRIFAQGFTTRKSGHGFGLHHAATTAGELGGQLTVTSEGPGRGAMFTLVLPSDSNPASKKAA
jgi:sensor domain CHASE-containing protein